MPRRPEPPPPPFRPGDRVRIRDAWPCADWNGLEGTVLSCGPAQAQVQVGAGRTLVVFNDSLEPLGEGE